MKWTDGFHPLVNIWRAFRGLILAEKYPSRRGIAQRAAYQRIIILANFAILAMVFMLAWWINSLDTPMSEKVDPGEYKLNKVLSDSNQVKSDRIKAAKASTISLNPYQTRHEGFLGFVGFDVVSDNNRTFTPIADVPYYYDIEAEVSDIISYSPFEGDETGFYTLGLNSLDPS